MKSVSAKRLYQYWDDLRGSNPAPERRDIEPAAIKSLLSDIFILEHVSGTDFSYRLAGSSLCAAYCRELKGRSFGQFWGEKDLEAIDTMMLAIREDAAAAVVGFNGVNARGQRAPFEMLLLPLRYGGEDYPRVLGIAVPSDSDYWLGLHPVEHHEMTSMRLIWPDEQPSFLRHAVNADALLESDLLGDDPSLQDLVEGDFGISVRETNVSETRANARRQAFRVISGGRAGGSVT